MHDKSLNLTVILDPENNVPYIIRSYENHAIYGPSMHDLLVYDYIPVDGVLFPRRFKTVYNNDLVLEDFLATSVLVNVATEDLFSGGSAALQASNTPSRNSSYDFSEIGEWYSNLIWSGPYGGTLSGLNVTNPFSDLPGLWYLNFGVNYSRTSI